VFKIRLENRNQNAFSNIAKKSITPQPFKLDPRKLICKYFHTCWTTLLNLPLLVFFNQSVQITPGR